MENGGKGTLFSEMEAKMSIFLSIHDAMRRCRMTKSQLREVVDEKYEDAELENLLAGKVGGFTEDELTAILDAVDHWARNR